jgi:hypothetical protein
MDSTTSIGGSVALRELPTPWAVWPLVVVLTRETIDSATRARDDTCNSDTGLPEGWEPMASDRSEGLP